jgi:hypothetical protein
MHPRLPMSEHIKRVGHAAGSPARHVNTAHRAKHDHLKAQQFERELRPMIPKGGHAYRRSA